MAKVLILSRTYPAYHIKKRQPTFFVEKFLNSVMPMWKGTFKTELTELLDKNIFEEKMHTIRSGNRFKAGDYFSPRVWESKPYRSRQIIICPKVQIQKVYNFVSKGGFIAINNVFISIDDMKRLAKNDGLLLDDMLSWFKFPNEFKGQIICWSNQINY